MYHRPTIVAVTVAFYRDFSLYCDQVNMSPIYVNRKGEFDLKTMYSALSPLNNPTSDRSSSTADNPLVDPFWLICECCVLRSRSYRSQQVKHVRIMQIPPGETCADHADHTRGMQRNSICLLYTSPSPRDGLLSRMPSSA